MYTLILTSHIVVSVAMVASLLATLFAAYTVRTTRFRELMLVSFGLTLTSGVGLLCVGAGIGRICLGMTISSVAVIVVQKYYTYKLATSTTV